MQVKINPKKELFKWGPIDGKLIYPDYFNLGFSYFNQKFYPWPNSIGYWHDEKVMFIVDREELINAGIKNYQKYLKKDSLKYFKLWKKDLQDLLKIQAKITKQNALELYPEWHEAYLKFWGIVLLPELANWGMEELLKQKLAKAVPSTDFVHVFERLSAPEKLSFYQQEELDLSKTKDLKKHQQKYFCLLNSYHHTRVLPVSYFAKRKKKLKPISRPRINKKQIAKKYNLSKEIKDLADVLSFSIWWQDYRKFYIFLANHYIDLFLKQLPIPYEHACYYNCQKVLDLVTKNKKVKTSEIKKRLAHTFFYFDEKTNKLHYLSGQKAKQAIKPYLEQKINPKTKRLKGTVVSQGPKIRGRVKILTSPKQVSKLKRGEILVASMTSPDYIMAIKKASALITDEGGMTCHAAIVSRELNIPCIVSTRIATKILKDGDLVEVDTEKGIVKKLH